MSNPEQIAKKYCEKLIADITDRRGWRQEYDCFDDDIKEEISKTYLEFFKAAIEEWEQSSNSELQAHKRAVERIRGIYPMPTNHVRFIEGYDDCLDDIRIILKEELGEG